MHVLKPLRYLLLTCAASLTFALLIVGCSGDQNAGDTGDSTATTSPTTTTDTPADPVARGEYLVTVAGCNDCHTPFAVPEGSMMPEPDMTRMLSGHPADLDMGEQPSMTPPWMWAGAGTMTAFAGPWGISYSANLTPDQNTGLAPDVWTDEVFIQAMRTGKHIANGRPLLPPMPWLNLAKMTDDDLKAIHAYLMSIPAIENRVPDPQMNPAMAGPEGAAPGGEAPAGDDTSSAG